MNQYPCTWELERWGDFQVRTLDALGYPSSSPLAWLGHSELRTSRFVSKIPAARYSENLEEYLLVERVLNRLGHEYRIVAIAEYVEPRGVVGKSMVKRATSVGLSTKVYGQRLKKIHEEIRKTFDLGEG